MCEMASFLFRPIEGVPVAVALLTDHSGTREKLKLGPDDKADAWHDGHYMPDNTIMCRCITGDTKTAQECAAEIKFRWPTFVDFFNWASKECEPDGVKHLDLGRLTSAAGLTIPKGVTHLYLSSLTSAAGLTIPKGVTYLYLCSLTSAGRERVIKE